ncbi:MAG: ATP-binding protein [Arenicellales bacterium]
MGSIQSRLTVYIVAGTAVLLIFAGIGIDRLLHRQLAGDFDRTLLYKAMVLVRLAEREGRIIEFDFNYDFMPEYKAREKEKAEYFELALPDGTPIAKSRSLGSASLPGATSPLANPVFRDINLPNGRKGRMVSFTFAPQRRTDDDEDADGVSGSGVNEDEQTLIQVPDNLAANVDVGISVAKSKASLIHLLDAIRAALSLTCLTLIVAVWLLVRFCVDRGLRPLREIAGEVRDLDSTKLHTRITTDPRSKELKPITDQLNHLLARLQHSFEREKRFSGNVAHELRTPIAELRTLAEVGKRWPGDQGMVEEFFGDLVSLADDMERTVTNLLSLARLDAGRQNVELESVNLSDLIEKCWKQISVEAEVKNVDLDNRISSDLRVTTDEDKLNLIVINLFSNAVSYCPPQSTIVVQAREADSEIQFSMSNLTLDLSERDLPLMFERFWRKDKARTKGRYAGLGLSLVQALGEILDLTVMPELAPDGLLTMTLRGFEPA